MPELSVPRPALTDLSPFWPGVIFAFQLGRQADRFPHWIITDMKLGVDSYTERTMGGNVTVQVRGVHITVTCVPVKTKTIADVKYELGAKGDSIYQLTTGDFWGMRHYEAPLVGGEIDVVYDWIAPSDRPRFFNSLLI